MPLDSTPMILNRMFFVILFADVTFITFQSNKVVFFYKTSFTVELVGRLLIYSFLRKTFRLLFYV